MRRVWIVSSVIACVGALVIWVVYTLKHSPESLAIFGAFLVVSFASAGLIERARRSRHD